MLPEWFKTHGFEVVKELNPCEILVKNEKQPGHISYGYRSSVDADDWTFGARPTWHCFYVVRFASSRNEAAASEIMKRFGASIERAAHFQTTVCHFQTQYIHRGYHLEGDRTFCPEEEDVERIPGVVKCIFSGMRLENNYRIFVKDTGMLVTV